MAHSKQAIVTTTRIPAERKVVVTVSLKQSYKTDGSTSPFKPAEAIVREIIRVLGFPFQAPSKSSALWHESYVDSIGFNEETDMWTAVIIEPNLD